MSVKNFPKWFKAKLAQSAYLSNAIRARAAKVNVVGKGTLVEKHLQRIADREQNLADFTGFIADSPALSVDGNGDGES